MTTATPAMMPQQRSKSTPVASPDAGAALKVFKTSVDKGNADEIRRCLIAWADAFYQDKKVLSLSQLSQHVGDTEFDALLQSLEQSIYSVGKDAEAFDKNALLAFVIQAHQKGSHNKKSKKDYGLPPLYKN